ncbi:MAG: hypothetical protein CVV33_00950 [Methanomicrobiales archaeon HGW-Methanomicrobiales-4]|nr:MAG: hypothetical protein CVV33_00950 [Methanomicrobiales archaeon HGW-Methanomicrobiales-4]
MLVYTAHYLNIQGFSLPGPEFRPHHQLKGYGNCYLISDVRTAFCNRIDKCLIYLFTIRNTASGSSIGRYPA